MKAVGIYIYIYIFPKLIFLPFFLKIYNTTNSILVLAKDLRDSRKYTKDDEPKFQPKFLVGFKVRMVILEAPSLDL